MMLIFDSFKTRQDAEQCASTIEEKFGLFTEIYDSQDAMDERYKEALATEALGKVLAFFDLFPFTLHPPIVLVERRSRSLEEEAKVVAEAEAFDARFAGRWRNLSRKEAKKTEEGKAAAAG
jgi:hypothetical protein